jgi:hypothetical protein
LALAYRQSVFRLVMQSFSASQRALLKGLIAVSNTKQILAMLRSRAEGDEDAFFSIALQVAASEARQGRRDTALEMRAEIDKARARNSRGAAVPIAFATPRGSLEGLLEMREPRYRLKDVVLNDPLLGRFTDILRQQRKRSMRGQSDANDPKRSSGLFCVRVRAQLYSALAEPWAQSATPRNPGCFV